MARTRVRHEQVNGGLAGVLRRLAELRRMDVTVGVQAEEGKLPDPGDDGSGPPVTVLTKAVANEFGTERVPERSFLRSSVDRYRQKWTTEARVVAKTAMAGDASPELAGNRLGNVMRGDVQQQITDVRTPPNAPATIAQKGSDNPLIDTDQMRQNIRYKVEIDGEDRGVG